MNKMITSIKNFPVRWILFLTIFAFNFPAQADIEYPLRRSERQMTLAAQLPPMTKAAGLLLQTQAANNDPNAPLKITSDKDGVLVEVKTAAPKPVLSLRADAKAVYDGKTHAIAVRHTGPRLELFIDGVLVDEEWPIGDILPANPIDPQKTKLNALQLHARALSDAEIESAANCTTPLEARKTKILGEERPVSQFWRPRGDSVFVGDCMPFFHDGRYHLYYLWDRRHHKSKWGLGAHQWAHISTADFKNWQIHPMAVSITEEEEGSICTGATFFHENVYYGFYSVRKAIDTPTPRLQVITSKDGIHFDKKIPLRLLEAPYADRSTRDPFVFQDPETGLFHMLVTTSLKDAPIAARNGCLAHLTSKDLLNWEQQPPFIVPGYPNEPECPEWFEWNGWYYLVFSNNAQTRYRMARSPLGPWQRPIVDTLDCASVHVMKSAPYHNNRRIGAGFVGAGGYAGHVVFREYIQQPDGSLGTCWVKELIPHTKAPLKNTFKSIDGQAKIEENCVSFPSDAGLSAVELGQAPESFVMRMTVRPAAQAAFFGIRFLAAERMEGGVDLRFEPTRQKASLRAVSPKARHNSIEEVPYTTLNNVSEIDRPFTVALLVKDGRFVDVEIDGRRTIARDFCGAATGDKIFLFAQDSEVCFDNIEIAPLSEE